MVLALLRRVVPAVLLLVSFTWLACSPDSDIAGPADLGEPSLAVAVGEPVIWEPQSGVTVTMQFLGGLISGGWSQAWGIDDANDVIVGQAVTEPPVYTAAFYWTAADGMQMIGAEGWKFTKAYDVRDNVIVGSGYFNDNPVAFRRIGTEITEIMEPLYPDAGLAVAEVVYKDNTAFGWRRDGSSRAAVEWGPTSDQAWLAFGDGINVRDANDSKYVVGAVSGPKAILWADYPNQLDFIENQILLDPLFDTFSGQAEGVNENTQVVGYMWGSSLQNRAFIWDPVAKTSELPGLGNDYNTKALDINDSELVVGESELPTGDEHAVAWMERQPIDLHPPIAGATTSTAQAVNNNGLIAGHVETADGMRAVVWTIEGDIGGGDEPLTPEEQLALLKDEIADLAAAGVINRFQTWSMTRKVNVALRSIEAGWIRWAIFQLRLLVLQVNSLVERGRLTPDQAEPLLELAQGAIDGLSGG
ncbi:MAG: hypothetical protein GTO46_08300 [Gemmatimonadetes bacterium]|nr:hypothetical protein [Gemmatimonadota bacterium]NIO31643.1 hypothetical protein [Gemmatimonadota bacterium]